MTRLSIVCTAIAVTALAVPAEAQNFVSLGPNTGQLFRVVAAPSNGSTLLANPGNDSGGLFKSTDTGATWTSIAPDSCGDVHVIDAVFLPGSTTTIFAGTRTAGVCRTTNGGQTWTSTSSGLPTQNGFPRPVEAIAINPSTTTTMLAGTDVGIYRSTDGGASWTAVTGGPTGDVGQFAISPSSPAVIYALSSTIHKSIDGGATWVTANAGLPALDESFLTVDPANANVAYVTSSGTVYKTSNGGTLWAAASSGLGNAVFLSNVAVDPSNSNTLYINALGSTGPARSTNGGTSWSAFPMSGLPSIPAFNVSNVYFFLFIDPVTPSRFIAATGDGMYRSTDSGATFTAINTNLAALEVKGPAVIPAAGGAGSLIVSGRNVADGSDIFKLTGGSLPFTAIGTPFSAADSGGVSFMIADPANSNTLYLLGGRVNGQDCALPYKSTNGGSTWTQMSNGLPTSTCGNNIAIDPTSTSTLYMAVSSNVPIGSSFTGLYKSTNGGSSWSASASGLPGGVLRVAISNSHPNILYAASFNQIFKSTNNGGTWSGAFSGLPTSCSTGSNCYGIVRIAIDPTDDNIVYASTQGGVYRTGNGGTSWSARTTGWPTFNGTVYSAYALAIDPTTPATIYAGPANPANGPTGGFLGQATRGTGIWRSTDSGATWSSLAGDVMKAFVNDIVFDGNRAIYAATGSGVFKASTGSAPTVTLSRNSLVFGAVNGGGALSSQSAGQTVRLGVGSGGSVSWTATADKPWLTVSPSSGSGTAVLTIGVKFDASLPASGTVTGNVAINLTGAANTVGPIAVTFNVVSSTAPASPPFGSFDTPAGDLTVLAGSVAVTGWTLDNIGVKQVELWRDIQPGETTPPGNTTPGDPRNGKIFIAFGTFVDNARPDVEGLYPTAPANYRAGWGYLMLTWGLFGQGNGTYKFYAFGVDQEGNTATIGTKTVIISNNTATKPFGSIDTPAIGGDASGPNFGWGLTPKVNGAATCKIQASGVQYSIDSGPLQPVVYGDVRTDIAGAFPGFSNSAAAGGHAIIDWNALTNGSHTIGWLITDDCSRADGVGSRFFNVTTGTALRAADTDAVVGGPSLFASMKAGETESDAAITVAHGYGELPEIVDPGTTGSRTIEMRQGERIEIRIPRGFESAYQLGPGGQRRALPVGSTWDEANQTFFWQPAPGFLGRFRLVFSNGSERISVRVIVAPEAGGAQR